MVETSSVLVIDAVLVDGGFGVLDVLCLVNAIGLWPCYYLLAGA